jgi:hypothetical protein
LAPDIVEAILDGRQPKAMQLKEVTRGKRREAGLDPQAKNPTAVQCGNRNLNTLEWGMIAAPVFA